MARPWSRCQSRMKRFSCRTPSPSCMARRIPAEAQKFFDYLRRPEISQRLVDAHALEGATLESSKGQPANDGGVETALLKDLDPATAEMEKIFLR